MGPLLTQSVAEQLVRARAQRLAALTCSLDLERTTQSVTVGADAWVWQGQAFPYPDRCKDRTVYYWAGTEFSPVARYTNALVKLVPTEWGPPTFEIDGIKMLPTARISPYADAQAKVALVEPRGKVVLDTCGGLGYFAACCIAAGAGRVISFEKNADVLWLRSHNSWSPPPEPPLELTHGDVIEHLGTIPAATVDAVLHDPPRFGIAGELYSRAFYDELARVIKRRGRLFHYTGTPNRLTSNRDVPGEVSRRLRDAGFATVLHGDGVLATRR